MSHPYETPADMFLSHRPIFVTMSNALTQNVPILVGDNYLEWAPKMKAYLMAQGQWASISTDCPEATDSNGSDIKDWNDNNDRATGNIILRLSSAIHQNLGDVDTAKELWDKLKEEYGKPGIPVVYQDFRAAIGLTIPTDATPIPALDKLQAHFNRLDSNKFDVPEHVKGMMLMSKLPPAMDSIIQVYISGLKPTSDKPAIKQITYAGIRQAVIMHWEQRQGRHGCNTKAEHRSLIYTG